MGNDVASDDFEGEALIVWGLSGVRLLVLAALHHTRSPFGPFTELAVGKIAIGLGPGGLPGLRRRTIAVGPGSHPVPEGAEVAALKWWAEGRVREVHWDERGLRLRAKIGRTGFRAPFVARMATSDAGLAPRGKAGLPSRGILARVDVEVPRDDPLAALAGRRHGLLASTARLALDESWLLLPRTKRVPPVIEGS